jgi:hypothetical protein
MNFNLQWNVNPLNACAAALTRLLDSLFVWLGARIEASKCRHDITAIRETAGATLRELPSKVDGIAARPLPAAPQEHPVVTQSMNLTRRSRAMHMLRRGEEPHTIAAALGISHGEVELLFKLDRILQQRG